MKTYADDHTVTLSVSDWLVMKIAMQEAITWNEDNNYPNCATEIAGVRDRLNEQICGVLDEAHAIITIEMQERVRL